MTRRHWHTEEFGRVVDELIARGTSRPLTEAISERAHRAEDRHMNFLRKRVRISGYEVWKIDNDGLIAESKGHFDRADYERQLKGQ